MLISDAVKNQTSLQGESDSEPDRLIYSITSKLGGIFSDDDSSEDADISETDENDENFDPSIDKPVFLTSKGPIQVSRGKFKNCCTGIFYLVFLVHHFDLLVHHVYLGHLFLILSCLFMSCLFFINLFVILQLACLFINYFSLFCISKLLFRIEIFETV